jgi:spore maturation protein CgeB
VGRANGGNRLLNAVYWHLVDRRPRYLDRFSAEIVAACRRDETNMIIVSGTGALTKSAVRALRAAGNICVNYSTDDPWNPMQRARWYLRALPEYDFVFTPRRANIEELRRLGCVHVHYLPFGYDDELFAPPQGDNASVSHDVLFVGGADRDRVSFMTRFMRSGPSVALVGGYWKRYAATKAQALGYKSTRALCSLTSAAKVNLCLVRRANRDGHVMRSFEIAAIGGCILAEDTAEHREIFGPDGEAVVYFRTPEEAAKCARTLLDAPAERARLSASVHARITAGAHTYRDRFVTMLRVVSDAAKPVRATFPKCVARESDGQYA